MKVLFPQYSKTTIFHKATYNTDFSLTKFHCFRKENSPASAPNRNPDQTKCRYDNQPPNRLQKTPHNRATVLHKTTNVLAASDQKRKRNIEVRKKNQGSTTTMSHSKQTLSIKTPHGELIQ